MTWIDCRNFGAQVIGNSADSFHLVSNFSDIAPLGRHMLRILFPARSRCLHKPKTTTGHKDKAVHKERLTPSSVRASPFICASRNTYIRYFWKCSVETLAAGVKRNSFVSDGTFTWLMSDYTKRGGQVDEYSLPHFQSRVTTVSDNIKVARRLESLRWHWYACTRHFHLDLGCHFLFFSIFFTKPLH